MKQDDTDPRRIVDDGDSELAKLVRASRARRLSSRATAQMVQRLAATSAYAAAASAATTRAGLLGRLGPAKVGVIALIGLGAAVFGWETRRSVEQLPTPTHEAEGITPHAPSSPASSPAPPPSQVTTAGETSSIPVEALPSSVTSAATAKQPARAVALRPSSAASTSARSAPTRDSEFALIRRAQDALASDPSQTLALVEEHMRAFPEGELVQEREVTAVEALARLGRMTEAKARAAAFRARYPRTPYGARIERALGESGAPDGPSTIAH